jgi:hypothetical protein
MGLIFSSPMPIICVGQEKFFLSDDWNGLPTKILIAFA